MLESELLCNTTKEPASLALRAKQPSTTISIAFMRGGPHVHRLLNKNKQPRWVRVEGGLPVLVVTCAANLEKQVKYRRTRIKPAKAEMRIFFYPKAGVLKLNPAPSIITACFISKKVKRKKL